MDRSADIGALLGRAERPRSRTDRLLQPLNRLATRRFLKESRAKVWANTRLVEAARRLGPDADATRLAGLERLAAARVADLVAPGQVVIKLAVKDRCATSRLRADPDIHAPHLVDAEVTNALRRKLLAGQLDVLRARRAIRRLMVMRLVRWQQTPLLGRALALRDRFTAYDAIYVAMAEATGATLLTRDARMARVGGHRARIELV